MSIDAAAAFEHGSELYREGQNHMAEHGMHNRLLKFWGADGFSVWELVGSKNPVPPGDAQIGLLPTAENPTRGIGSTLLTLAIGPAAMDHVIGAAENDIFGTRSTELHARARIPRLGNLIRIKPDYELQVRIPDTLEPVARDWTSKSQQPPEPSVSEKIDEFMALDLDMMIENGHQKSHKRAKKEFKALADNLFVLAKPNDRLPFDGATYLFNIGNDYGLTLQGYTTADTSSEHIDLSIWDFADPRRPARRMVSLAAQKNAAMASVAGQEILPYTSERTGRTVPRELSLADEAYLVSAASRIALDRSSVCFIAAPQDNFTGPNDNLRGMSALESYWQRLPQQPVDLAPLGLTR